jgi:trimeric autotransporter adhesin
MITDGKVGVNNDSPEYTLDVAGTIRWEGIYTISDERAKKSIEKIDSALAKITKLNGYSFTWKDSWEPDLWLLAQEVEKVFKEAVSTDKDGNKTVQYSALLAPIIEAIHELNSLVDEHYESKFDAQVKRIERIEQKLVK